MIEEKEIVAIADKFWRNQRKKGYQVDQVRFIEGRQGKYASEDRWIVRYMKPFPEDKIVDDGDYVCVVIVDPKTGQARLSEPI